MRREYEHSYMSDELKSRIISTCEMLESISGEDGADVRREKRTRIALVVITAVMIMTFSVYAAGEWYYEVFSRLFGSGADVAADIYSHPEAEVLENTFEGLDIQLKGVAATDSTLYVLLDITATDGTVFDTSDAGIGHTMRTGQGNYAYFSNPPRYSTYFFRFDTEDDDRLKYNGLPRNSYSVTASVLDIPDGDKWDNRMSIAWIEKNTLMEYPGSVVVLSINEISKGGVIVKEGTWKVKFTVPENRHKAFETDVNQKTGMLRHEVFNYSSPDEYVYDDIEIQRVKLDTLGIEYTWTADNEDFMATHTFHEWIEMKDGSIVGYPDITEASHHGDMFMRSGKQGGSQGMIRKTFDKPIDINNVKVIHIGKDLTIYVD